MVRRGPRRHFQSSLALGLALSLAGCGVDGSKRAQDPGAAGAREVASILANSNLPSTLEAPMEVDPMGVTIHRLSNGMTVYISTDRSEPKIAAWLPVRTGSRNDPANSTGLAHYLEHMLFKGTDELGTLDIDGERPFIEEIADLYDELRSVGDDAEARAAIFARIDAATQASAKFAIPNEFDRLYAEMGVSGVNAFTWVDQTVYIATIPSNRLESWATVERERFSDPVFRLFFTELEAVYEEKNISLDSPFRRVLEKTMLAMFPNHPYGTQSTIGSVEHLKTPAYGDMEDYFDRWYGPNNMAIVLAGDIDAETALPVLERTFGTIPPRPLGTPEPAVIEPMKDREVRTVIAEGETSVAMAWQTVPVGHEDVPALRVMDLLTDNGATGLLNVRLTAPLKVARASSSPSFYKEAGLWDLSAQAREGQTHEELESLLLGIVGALRAGEFTDEDLASAKLELELREQRGLEEIGARASTMTDAFIEGREWRDVVAQRARVQSVTREDIMRVATRYLGDAYVIVQRTPGEPELPEIQKPNISPIQLDRSRKSAFYERVLSEPVSDLESVWLEEGTHYARATLTQGPLISARNERNGLFSLTMAFDVTPADSQRLCFGLDLFERSGTGASTNEQLKKQLASLGVDLSVRCGDYEVDVSLDGLDRNLEPAMALVESWFSTVAISPELVEESKATRLRLRAERLTSPDFLAYALRSYGLYGEKSSFLMQATDESLSAYAAADIEREVRNFLGATRRTIYYGPRSPEDVRTVLDRSGTFRETRRREGRTFRKVKRPTIYFMNGEVAKSSVAISFPMDPAKERGLDAQANARFWSAYLSGGMGGLIFQEVREARGLAYSAYARVATGRYPDDEWSLQGQLGTQGDKTVEALELMLSLLREHDFEEDSFELVRTSQEARFRSERIKPRYVPRSVESWAELGLEGDPRPMYRDAMRAMAREDLQAWADGLSAAPVITVYGNREAVDLARLRKIGDVVELKPTDVVSW